MLPCLKDRVEKTNTGIKAEGELGEIAEFSEEMMDALEDVSDHEETIENFDYWKPEKDDEEENIKDRTASLESISKKKVEKESNGLREDFSEAKEELENKNNGFNDSNDVNDKKKKAKVLKAYKKLFKPIFSGSLKFFRQIEELIYSKLMLNFNPYYFNARKFSVCLKEKDEEFEIIFNSPEKEYRRTLRRSFDVGE